MKRPNGTNHHGQARHIYKLPSDAILRVCVHALQAWDGFTSSEIERGFGAIKRTLGKCGGSMEDDCKSRVAKLLLDIRKGVDPGAIAVEFTAI